MAKRKNKALTNYLDERHATPQSEPMHGKNQVQNSVGGYVFQLGLWQRLDRFLILGTDGGSYYASERTLTRENAQIVLDCLFKDGLRTVNTIVEMSTSGRAPKNTPAIFALALAAAEHEAETRQAALAALPQVCRTATHLFQFMDYVKALRGWGRALKRGVGKWYTEKDTAKIGYQMTKYRQREGWTHADVLRLAHPKPKNAEQNALFQWTTQEATPEWATDAQSIPDDDGLRKVWAFEQAKRAQDVTDIVQLITDYDLVREAIPNQFLNTAEVWDALLQKMPMGAMLRNLGNMAKVGLLVPMSDAERIVVERLNDMQRIQKARLHPLSVLSAIVVYGQGQGMRGSGTWTPTPAVKDALDKAFELSFGTITPANKRTMLALDVSGSMEWGLIGGVPGITPRVGSAAMAMATARTEKQYSFMAFSHELVPVDIHARMSLHEVTKNLSHIPMGGTDCALPMLYAINNKLKVDTFIVYTDNETWFGKIHPVQALQQYRDKMGIPAKLIVVGMVANKFSIADPDDNGMLDVVGFDTAAPNIMNDFSRGDL